MRALVTGASGFIGYWVVKELLAADFEIRVLVRENLPDRLRQLPVEICHGDLREQKSLEKALTGCDHLFHVAAHYKLWAKSPQIFYDINVEGTRKLLNVAKQLEIPKIVYTSSVATLKVPEDAIPANEDSEAALQDIVGHYKKSKYLAEMVAKEMAMEGLPIVIVNPSAPVGPADVKPTPTGKIILDFLKGKMPAYMDTGLNLIAVEDVAKGHLLAARKGKNGRRYILGNKNLSLLSIFKMLENITGFKST